MKHSTLASYAILKVNWEQPERKDYLDNFVLIVAEAIRHLPDNIISLKDLQTKINSMFGLEIPQNTINSLLKRVKKQGYIKVDHGVYTKDEYELDKLNFSKIEQSVRQSYESLLGGLVQFVSEKYNESWTANEAENALEEYLQENQVRLLNDIINREISSIEVKTQYIVAKFIEHLQILQSSELDFLETIIKGNLLANSIFLTEPSTYQRKFSNTMIFLDTSLVIYALGYAGEPRKWPVLELINLLKNYGANLAVFRHSYDEIVGILSACSEVFRRRAFEDSYGPSIEYFIEHGYSETDIMMFIRNLETDLANLGLSIVDKPDYDDHKNIIDEEAYCQYLKENIYYSKERPLERDKDSIAAIFRLRKGQTYIYLEECRALFVTSNTGLAYSTRDYFEFNYKPGTASLAITDYELTNLVWLKDPTLSPNLPRRRLIATSYAAVQPSDSLWSKYLQTIKGLEEKGELSNDQYFILRHSIQAKSELMEKTRGNEEVFTEGTIDEILNSVVGRIRAEDIEKLNSEMQAKREALQKFESEREVRIKLQEEIEQNKNNRREKINNRAEKLTKWSIVVLNIFFSILLGYLTYAISPLGPLNIDPNNVIPKNYKTIGLITFWILLTLQVLSTIFEIGPKALTKYLKPRIKEKIIKLIDI